MKVSVLMATVGSATLRRSLESLLSQQGVELQVVLVNDNPGFAVPPDILRLDRRLTVVDSGRNRGLAGALNWGFAYCDGEIIVRQDDDDLSLPGRLSTLVSAFRERPEPDIVCSWAIGYSDLADSAGRPLLRTPRDDADLMRRIRFRNCIIHSTIAMTRSAFARLEGYSENFRYAQDYDLYLRSLALGLTFHVIQKPLVEKHMTPGSVTVSRRTNQILHSLAAQCLYYGKRSTAKQERWLIMANVMRLFIPDALRRVALRVRFR